MIGRLIADQEIVPDLILSSSARRALATAQLIADASGYERDIIVSRDIYHAETDTYIELLRQITEKVSSVMIVGHNPGLEEFVEELSGDYVRMPTAALVVITLPISSWSHIDSEVAGRIVNVWLPREL